MISYFHACRLLSPRRTPIRPAQWIHPWRRLRHCVGPTAIEAQREVTILLPDLLCLLVDVRSSSRRGMVAAPLGPRAFRRWRPLDPALQPRMDLATVRPSLLSVGPAWFRWLKTLRASARRDCRGYRTPNDIAAPSIPRSASSRHSRGERNLQYRRVSVRHRRAACTACHNPAVRRCASPMTALIRRRREAHAPWHKPQL